jgi:hypothetical protein
VITDVELSRALNALATTLKDQRPPSMDRDRFQAIVDGALAGQRKLIVRREDDGSGVLLRDDDGGRVGSVALRDGEWSITREVDSTGSGWAQPRAGS